MRACYYNGSIKCFGVEIMRLKHASDSCIDYFGGQGGQLRFKSIVARAEGFIKWAFTPKKFVVVEPHQPLLSVVLMSFEMDCWTIQSAVVPDAVSKMW